MTRDSADLDYDRRAQAEIEAWKGAGPSRFARWTGFAFAPLDAPIGKALESPRVQQVIQRAMEKALDAGSWSVPTAGIVASYVESGYEVGELRDVPEVVPLRAADERAHTARRRHTGAAIGTGTAGGLAVVVAAGSGAAATPTSGGASLPAGLAAAIAAAGADIVATTGLCCRVVALTAAHYGFDTEDLGEREYALQVLNTALADTNEDKFAALTSIATLRNQLIRVKQPWAELEKSALASSIRKAAAKLGRSITQAQLRRITSLIGVLTAGGFNGFQMHDVARTSYFMYRERFLIAKYGEDGTGRPLSGPQDRSARLAAPSGGDD
jgi:hypothetical protein